MKVAAVEIIALMVLAAGLALAITGAERRLCGRWSRKRRCSRYSTHGEINQWILFAKLFLQFLLLPLL